MNSGPLIRLAGLWQRTSAHGTQYFVGRIGGAKILLLPNRDADGEGEPTHLLFVTPAIDKPGETSRRPDTNSAPAARPPRSPGQRRYRNAYEHLRPATTDKSDPANGRPFDDPIPEL